VPDASDTTEATEATETEVTDENTETPTDHAEDNADDAGKGDTFPRDYVEKLRKESAGYRDRARAAEAQAEELSRALFTSRVSATGKLADATDLEYNTELIHDADKLTEAVDSLIEAKPHLKARKPSGDVGQGLKGDSAGQFSLLDRLKGNV
jgi:hypothetical protein